MFGLVVLDSDWLNVWTVDSILEIHLLWILPKLIQKKKKKKHPKLIILLITPPQKGKGASSALSIYLQESDHRCTHLSCVRSKNESECINFQCQNFRAFVALKSVSRIVYSIFNKTRTTDRTMVGTRQNRVIIGP